MLQSSRNIHKRNQPAPRSSLPPAAGIHNFCDYLQQLSTRSFLQILKRLQKTPKKQSEGSKELAEFFSVKLSELDRNETSLLLVSSLLSRALSLPASCRGARARARSPAHSETEEQAKKAKPLVRLGQ